MTLTRRRALAAPAAVAGGSGGPIMTFFASDSARFSPGRAPPPGGPGQIGNWPGVLNPLALAVSDKALRVGL